MHGMGAAVVGLVFVTTARIIRASIRGGGALLVAAVMFVLVGPLRVNTLLALLLLGPLSLWLHRPRSGS
jgi:chromate transport protein ChrA